MSRPARSAGPSIAAGPSRARRSVLPRRSAGTSSPGWPLRTSSECDPIQTSGRRGCWSEALGAAPSPRRWDGTPARCTGAGPSENARKPPAPPDVGGSGGLRCAEWGSACVARRTPTCSARSRRTWTPGSGGRCWTGPGLRAGGGPSGGPNWLHWRVRPTGSYGASDEAQRGQVAEGDPAKVG